MLELFREKAVGSCKQKLHGDVIVLPKISHNIVTSFLLLWTFVTSIWLIASHYSRKQTVLGWLEPPEGIVRIHSDNTGVVKKVLVKEGETVTKNQPLLMISDEHILEGGESLHENLLKEHISQRSMLKEQIFRTDSTYKLNLKDISEQILSARQNLKLIEGQVDVINERYLLVSSQVERYRKLKNDGFVANSDFDNVLAQELSLNSERKALLRNQISQKNAIAQLEKQQKVMPDENANALDQLRIRLSDIEQKINQINSNTLRIINAPISGVVNNLQAREGQQITVAGNIPLLTLFPDNSMLSAQLLIPVRSVGFIEKGQLLAIRYDAFPYQKFGIYEARIEQISKTLLLPNELMDVPVSTKEPVYRVNALLKKSSVNAYGKDFLLKPGMTLAADINLGDRTLIEWIFEPLYSLKGRI